MNVIVTGASRGLGHAIAEKFAANGYDLYLSARNEQGLKEAATGLIKKYPNIKIHWQAADLSTKEGTAKFSDWLNKKSVAIDVLINNAGSFVPGNVSSEPDGALEQMMNVNLFSAYHLTRSLLPAMKNRNAGHIFNMCSIASLKAYENGGAYSISKFALLGLTMNLREELKGSGIKVTAVLPGAAYTDSWKSSGISPERIMEADDISTMVFAAAQLSPQACVEQIIVRPQLGDL